MKFSSKGQIVIPKDLRGNIFTEGSQAAIVAYSDHIEIRPLSYVLGKLECALASENSFAKEWDSPDDDQAWENLLEHAMENQQTEE
ncbi:AbrB/MazE/SpoVT family DNA-binding domain-containing protein [Methanosalsum natronophilum]|uniref:AbrB/MazE/SpoVT family DNA-binding domain-containing protein n=1 Tax=Methanosalsum natronophilum TaxID=768733 RepID=UPI002169EAA9|nr:AbrB/MazE/SpoVT family DNA-binding domain-containing protein [Methanosalsum natronophilum]MCS3923904.1 bifunctional DNA-binding transcriptional regulator/antitoxin component of YhaV-PrlF toxin-antitoxin module [Methanosalsum natronophilum]